jgi:gliding-associated putative ABC transporter substrate-binding component GldG
MRSRLSFLYTFVFVVLVNILFSFTDFSFDLTEDKKHSISAETKQILSELDDIIFIKVYLGGDFPAEFKHLQSEVLNLLTSFKSIVGANFDFEFINPNKLVNEEERMNLFKQLGKAGLSPTDIEIKTSSSNSNQIIFPCASLYYKDKQQPVNFLKNSITKQASENINVSVEGLEFEFISAIQHLTKTKLDKIAFLEGNGELDEHQVYDITKSVLDDNFNLSYYYNVSRFNIKEFSIDSTTMLPDLSRQLLALNTYKTIIIAKPTIPFNQLEKLLIDQYVMQGGKVLWLVDGVIANMDSLNNQSGSFVANKNKLNIDDQLLKYGVKINSNLVEDLRSSKIPIITGYSNNKPQQSYFQWPYFPLLVSDSKHPISKGLDGIKCSFISSIDTIKNNIKKTILLHSSKQSRLNLSPTKVSLGILENLPPIESYNKKHEPVAVLLEGEFESLYKNRLIEKDKDTKIKLKEISKKTKMIIVADGDIIANKVNSSGTIFPLAYEPNIKYTYPGNKHFLINAIQYLCDDNGLSYLKTKELSLRMLDKERVNKNRLIIQLINIVLPILILLIFAFFFSRDKERKYA